MNRKLLLAVALFLAWIGLASVAKAQNESWAAVRAANHPAIVYLKTEIRYPNGLVEETGATGFLVHPDGWILTCAHVVPQQTDEAKAKGVMQSTTASVGGRGELGRMVAVIRRDTDKDLALLKLKHEAPQPWPTVTVDSDGALGLDQDVYALGFPAANREGLDGIHGTIRGRLGELWVMSVPINPGNSGGPVFSREGRVVGIAKGALPDSAQMNVVIPIRLASNWLYDIGVGPARARAAVPSPDKVRTAINKCTERWGAKVSSGLVERYEKLREQGVFEAKAAMETGGALLEFFTDQVKGQAAYDEYLQCLKPALGESATEDQRPTIVLIGSTEDYNDYHYPGLEATSVELLHKRLGNFEVREFTVNYGWENWQAIRDIRPTPAAIVMHASSFHHDQYANEAVEKFQAFVSWLRTFMPTTKLVVFTRLPGENPSAALCQRWRRQVDFLTSETLRDNLIFYPLNRSESSFTGKSGIELGQMVRCLSGLDATAYCSAYMHERMQETQYRIARSSCSMEGR